MPAKQWQFELLVHYQGSEYTKELDDRIEKAAGKEAWATGFLLVGDGARDMAFSYDVFEVAVKARLAILKIGYPIKDVYIREARTSHGNQS